MTNSAPSMSLAACTATFLAAGGTGPAAQGHGGFEGRRAGRLGCPQTFLYGQPPALASVFARIQNEQLAKLVKARPERFRAIATLPMQAPTQAADELRHAVTVLGLAGAQIGSNVAGKNLDDPELEPVWATAAELDAFMLVHPINVAGADRLSSYYLTNLIGNPLDTTIAAACLVFSGVLERYPRSRSVSPMAAGSCPTRPVVSCMAGRCTPSKAEAAQAADRFDQAVLFRYHRALEGSSRFPCRHCGDRPGAARQRLSFRHGNAGRSAASPRAFRRGGGTDIHSRRDCAKAARTSGRQAIGARLRLKAHASAANPQLNRGNADFPAARPRSQRRRSGRIFV